MASLQARHTRDCARQRETKNQWTSFVDAPKGCRCAKPGPLYHVAYRAQGKLVREPVGHNRKEAERALDRHHVAIDDGTWTVKRDATFENWSTEWFAALKRPGANTLRSYRTTMDHAKKAFGHKKVRAITGSDIHTMIRNLEESGTGSTTIRRHVRVVGSCLDLAVRRGLAGRNVVNDLGAEELPRVTKPKPSYYTDAELLKLWKALDDDLPIYRYLFKFLTLTGMRAGEAYALTWADVKLLDRLIRVHRSVTEGKGVDGVLIGVGETKSHRERDVHLDDTGVKLLEAWYRAAGAPADDALVFPHPVTGSYLRVSATLKYALTPALERAHIPIVGEGGRSRGQHSLRHTYARITLQSGASIAWLKEQLGHSSINLTVDTYGSWEKAAKQAQAKKLTKAFASRFGAVS